MLQQGSVRLSMCGCVKGDHPPPMQLPRANHNTPPHNCTLFLSVPSLDSLLGYRSTCTPTPEQVGLPMCVCVCGVLVLVRDCKHAPFQLPHACDELGGGWGRCGRSADGREVVGSVEACFAAAACTLKAVPCHAVLPRQRYTEHVLHVLHVLGPACPRSRSCCCCCYCYCAGHRSCHAPPLALAIPALPLPALYRPPLPSAVMLLPLRPEDKYQATMVVFGGAVRRAPGV